jgi:hypothetical protein
VASRGSRAGASHASLHPLRLWRLGAGAGAASRRDVDDYWRTLIGLVPVSKISHVHLGHDYRRGRVRTRAGTRSNMARRGKRAIARTRRTRTRARATAGSRKRDHLRRGATPASTTWRRINDDCGRTPRPCRDDNRLRKHLSIASGGYAARSASATRSGPSVCIVDGDLALARGWHDSWRHGMAHTHGRVGASRRRAIAAIDDGGRAADML